MTDHPLTHEIIEKLVEDIYETDFNDCDECEDNLFARAAADWQLERDAEWWRIILNRMKILDTHAVNSIVEEFKTAMRPQEDDQ